MTGMGGSRGLARAVVLALFGLAGSAGGMSAQGGAGSLTVEDYLEIQELYAKYTRAVDMGGCWGDGVACKPYTETFVDRAPDAVVNYHKRIREEGWASRHTYSGLLITPTPEGADGSVYALIYNVTAVPPFVDHSVYYLDTLVRTPNGWRFLTRRIVNNTRSKPSLPPDEP
ncbi:MAG: nuclear transport factor 2 family protein [Acidimicrobiia bacterium]|nr:nuclear transport factor 2 family protein [Acidimicrobiia bacterium]